MAECEDCCCWCANMGLVVTPGLGVTGYVCMFALLMEDGAPDRLDSFARLDSNGLGQGHGLCEMFLPNRPPLPVPVEKTVTAMTVWKKPETGLVAVEKRTASLVLWMDNDNN